VHAIAWAPVWQALPKLSSLRELELGGNAFGTEAVAGLRRALSESRLDTLRLGSGALLPLSAHGVALTVDRGVLDLSGAGLTAADAALVSAALERLRREGHAAPLTALDLSGNGLALEAIADEAELVIRHDIAGMWVVFFQECQQHRCVQGDQSCFAHQLGAGADFGGDVEPLRGLLEEAAQLPALASLDLSGNGLGVDNMLRLAPSVVSAVLRLGPVDLSGNTSTRSSICRTWRGESEARDALALLTAGAQTLSWCKVMHARLGSGSVAAALPPDLVRDIADLVIPTPSPPDTQNSFAWSLLSLTGVLPFALGVLLLLLLPAGSSPGRRTLDLPRPSAWRVSRRLSIQLGRHPSAYC